VNTLTGLDVLLTDGFQPLLGKAVGVLCNQASIARDYRHILDHLMPLHWLGKLQIKAIFGPQHGLWGHTQDNMIEWEGGERAGVPLFSLYGEHREPTAEMLAGIELLVVDLVDVGSRYYTFIWTMALCLKACERIGIPVLVLDRPNPIGGTTVEGTVLDPAFASFVGLYPLSIRHGMTIGEIARFLVAHYFSAANVRVVEMRGYERAMLFEDTGLPWAMPSPNMPSPATARVYPGGCLVEGTMLSEGRGTTRPFEIIGAPYLDGWQFCRTLEELELPGVHFRAIQFQPTFQKHAGQVCEGAFVHVLDPRAFKPFLTYVAIIQQARAQSEEFAWKQPPYEYEEKLLPFDILAGNDWLRRDIEDMTPVSEIQARCVQECDAFEAERRAALLY
jgi:uncharacterized protein YbbC (DUF1343 family)